MHNKRFGLHCFIISEIKVFVFEDQSWGPLSALVWCSNGDPVRSREAESVWQRGSHFWQHGSFKSRRQRKVLRGVCAGVWEEQQVRVSHDWFRWFRFRAGDHAAVFLSIRWSFKKHFPSLGAADASFEEVDNFYSFW